MSKRELFGAVERNLPAAVDLLSRLIEFPSLRGQERDIGIFLKQATWPLADTAELIPIPDSLMADPDYSFKLKNFRYEGIANLRATLSGTRNGRRLAFNTHLDVVPPSPDQKNPFVPETKDGKVFGRGACDAKGQMAILWLVLRSLHDLGLKPGGDITIDVVVEEECGGNGTLKIVRDGLAADGAVVLEPTGLQVAHLVRGAVWFEVRTKGKAGHSGSPSSTSSALKEVVKVMEAIERVHQELLTVSRNAIDKIANHPDPMPCTFGTLHSGNWPAAAPSEAVLQGVFGFLPPFKREEIQEKLERAVASFQAEVSFNMLNSNPSFIPADHFLVRTLIDATEEAGFSARPAFMNASCDSWRYTEQLGIPAVVFGGGTIAAAHSGEEHIPIEDIRKAALTLVFFIDQWGGLYHV